MTNQSWFLAAFFRKFPAKASLSAQIKGIDITETYVTVGPELVLEGDKWV
jgi:hypothetical protein